MPVPDTFDSKVTDLRTEVDAIDSDIAALVLRRAQVSREIQEFRMAGGGVRVDPARERKIVAFYRSRLGNTGVHLATRILLHCRSRLGSDGGSQKRAPNADLADGTDEPSAVLRAANSCPNR